ncbi:MAG: DUF1800 family protein [Pedosphaera sp.]|nr:DUF1800 family protein [Pedosphaera sp.]
MRSTFYCAAWLVLLTVSLATNISKAQDNSILGYSLSQGQQQLRFKPQPSVEAYQVLRADRLGTPFLPDGSGKITAADPRGFLWTAPFRTDELGFYQLKAVPMASNDLLAATVLNRLAYGPTPDELERVKIIGADAYIQEQLAPELIQEQIAADTLPREENGWRYVTVTGTGSASDFYIYLTTAGDGYIDDIKLETGTSPEAGQNLLRNGDFEKPLISADWTIESNHAASVLSTDLKRSGGASLHVIASAAGSTKASAIWQTITPALSANQTYTLSYWYHQGSNRTTSATVRLSGNGITTTSGGSTPLTLLLANEANIDALRSWHVMRAVQSKRQLTEVLLQFLENHFVTEYTKSRDWLDKFYDDPQRSWEAVNLEFREIQRWREALLNPKCTFLDLLKISAESPAMIVFLDTVTSNGSGTQIANENYARELLELFTFGVDNGYDQNDIVETSKAWSGWRVAMQKPENQFNPLATPLFHPSNEPKEATNHVGIWTFWYRPDRHNNTAKTIFQNKTVPDRFGAPFAGRNYQLTLPARAGNAGMQDGYDIVAHLADQPFTQEFISVKLCRLFVHDDFVHGVYDYTDASLPPEAKLVRQCMDAWENASPKGQIRPVLVTIFNSELFRSRAASQKIKTPIEYTVSAIRALRAKNPDGTFTADTDGAVSAALVRMGNMKLFDRAEPDGYPETAPAWISAGTLAERLRWVQSLLTAKSQRNIQTSDAGNSVNDPVAVVRLKLPQSDWNNAEAVASYFVQLLYPGEGRANLDLYRGVSVSFLNTDNTGTVASAFSSLTTTGNPSPYDMRLRGMVAALMTFQRFHEQ